MLDVRLANLVKKSLFYSVLAKEMFQKDLKPTKALIFLNKVFLETPVCTNTTEIEQFVVLLNIDQFFWRCEEIVNLCKWSSSNFLKGIVLLIHNNDRERVEYITENYNV